MGSGTNYRLFSNQIRVNALVCLGKMLENLDKYAVLDDIIPLMNQIPSREPPTLMAILGKHIHPWGSQIQCTPPPPENTFYNKNLVVNFYLSFWLAFIGG